LKHFLGTVSSGPDKTLAERASCRFCYSGWEEAKTRLAKKSLEIMEAFFSNNELKRPSTQSREGRY
jgi:hypothetical protein